jgi:F0F1-type ATP synthase membrane subunit b/b'
MEQRVAVLSGEIAALKERLRRDGEREREALGHQGDEEAARLVAQIGQEAARRVEEARRELASEAAAVAAELALDLLQRELTPEDRERIFRTTLERLSARATGGVR